MKTPTPTHHEIRARFGTRRTALLALGVGLVASISLVALEATPALAAATPTLTMTAPSADTPNTPILASAVSAFLASGSASPNPTGTINFMVFGPQSNAPTSCSSGSTAIGTATVNGNGTYSANAGFTPSSAGSYWWYATYSGDANNAAATSVCGASMPQLVVSTNVAAQPGVTLAPASSITATSATLSGTVNANGLSTTYYFAYGTSLTSPATTATTSAGTGTSALNVSANVTGLQPNTNYKYELVATNSDGTSTQSNAFFDTSSLGSSGPAVSTGVTSATSTSGTTLSGTVYPNGLDTTYYFEYGTSTNYGSQTAVADAGLGGSGVSVSAPISGLSANTTYDYQLVASNAFGTSYGGNQTMTTGGSVSTSISLAAPMASAPGAPVTLSASVLPANATGTVEFVNGSTPIAGCSAVPVSNGSAQCTTTFPTSGAVMIAASFIGNIGFGSSNSNPLHYTVAKLVTRSLLGVRSTKLSFRNETSERFHVVLAGPLAASATGKVRITATKQVGWSKTLCVITLATGRGDCVLHSKVLALGSYHVSATYTGSASFASSISPMKSLIVIS